MSVNVPSSLSSSQAVYVDLKPGHTGYQSSLVPLCSFFLSLSHLGVSVGQPTHMTTVHQQSTCTVFMIEVCRLEMTCLLLSLE